MEEPWDRLPGFLAVLGLNVGVILLIQVLAQGGFMPF